MARSSPGLTACACDGCTKVGRYQTSPNYSGPIWTCTFFLFKVSYICITCPASPNIWQWLLFIEHILSKIPVTSGVLAKKGNTSFLNPNLSNIILTPESPSEKRILGSYPYPSVLAAVSPMASITSSGKLPRSFLGDLRVLGLYDGQVSCDLYIPSRQKRHECTTGG